MARKRYLVLMHKHLNLPYDGWQADDVTTGIVGTGVVVALPLACVDLVGNTRFLLLESCAEIRGELSQPTLASRTRDMDGSGCSR